MSKIKNWNSHIILYAKGWYERTDIVEDLKILIGKRNHIEPQYISKNEIIRNLLHIIEELPNEVKDFRMTLSEFISDIDPKNLKFRLINEDYDFDIAVITKCLSVLSLIKIYDNKTEIYPLDEPDENILPYDKN